MKKLNNSALIANKEDNVEIYAIIIELDEEKLMSIYLGAEYEKAYELIQNELKRFGFE